MSIPYRNRDILKEMLQNGYGVEDIALKTGYQVQAVREVVNDWRGVGKLREIFGHASDPRREFRFKAAMSIMTGSN